MGCGQPGEFSLGTVAIALIASCRPDPGSLGDDRRGFDTDSEGPGDTAGDPSGRFDLGDTGGDAGGCGCPMADGYPYLWIANMAESTVSKIDTRTVREVGRYLTHPDWNGSPSRTAVSPSGRRASVANRTGGVLTIWSELADCVDRNGNGIIDTSSGAADILPFGADECVDWYGDYGLSTNYPVAWTCLDGRELLWTGGMALPGADRTVTDRGDPDLKDGIAILLDGTDGSVRGEAVLVDMASDTTGPYVGTVDPDGNLWTLSRIWTTPRLDERALFQVDVRDLGVERFEVPADVYPYSLTADASGGIWMTSHFPDDSRADRVGAARFDPAAGTWQVARGFSSDSGLTVAPSGEVWVAPYDVEQPGLGMVDPQAMAITLHPTTGAGILKAIAIDDDGYIWTHDRDPGLLYKVAPDGSDVVATYSGLVEPYTHGDMGGWALRRTLTCPSRPAG